MNTAQENNSIRAGIGAFVKTNYEQAVAAFGETPSATNFLRLEEAMWALQGMMNSANSDMVILRQVWTGPAKDIVPTIANTHKRLAEAS